MTNSEKWQYVLEIEDLSITYETRKGEVPAVRHLSLQVRPGGAYGLVGESGCGKSTAAMALMNYLDPNARIDSGRILFQGQNILEMSSKELRHLRGNRIAMVYQDPMLTLNPSLRVREQLVEVLTEHREISKNDAYNHCVEMLHKVKMPDPEQVMTRYPHQLSGGQQQRVVIAMALLCDPALLVMDEPTTALDVTVEATVLDMIATLRQEFDSAILYISHNLGVIARVCDWVGVMYAGEMVEEASVEEIFKDPYHPYTRGLMGCVPSVGTDKTSFRLSPIPGRVPSPHNRPNGCLFCPRCGYSLDRCQIEHPDLIETGAGRSVRCGGYERVRETGPLDHEEGAVWGCGCDDPNAEPILEVEDLKMYYEDKPSLIARLQGKKTTSVKAVDDVTLGMAPKSILGVVGESGCGKTSLAKTIAGLAVPSAGKIGFLGTDVTKIVEKRPHDIIKELQMIFQNPDSTLNPTKTVYDILSRPLRRSKLVKRSEIRNEVIRLLESVKLSEDYLRRKSPHMSGGEKQRVSIARAFATRPELVVCDEPVSALDVSVQASVLNTLLGIQDEFGTALLFISHDLSVVRYLCDCIAVMYLGKVCEIGPAEALFSPPYHPYTEALLSAVPVPDPTINQARIRLEGNVPSAINPPSGCRFNTRCPRKIGEICETVEPPLRLGEGGHEIYCHIPLEELSLIPPVIYA